MTGPEPDRKARAVPSTRVRRGRATLPGLVMVAVLAVLPGIAASAAEPDPVAPTGTDSAPGPIGTDADRARLTAWIDGVIDAQRRAHRIPGAAVAMVTSDDVVLLEGWGHADLDQRRQVDPQRTLFRIGSVTKTFTWAAIVRAIDAGRLDLDSDVNDYLDELEVPVHSGRPVTLADLMTHSAGFEDRITGTLAPSPGSMTPLGTWLASHRPEQVQPPGMLPAYSNYGTALAARVLEQTSGRDWAETVQTAFLEPLSMERTLTDQQIPDRLEAHLAHGYRFIDGSYRQTPFWAVEATPAAGMTSTAADMARWLRMHLGAGILDGRRVMTPSAAELMQSPLRRFHPDVPPFLHGFYRMDRAGERILGHSGSLGDTVGFMALFPEHDLGVFAVYNADAEEAPAELLDALVEWLAQPELPEPRMPPADFASRAERYVGEYASSRRNQSTLETAALLAGGVEVAVNREGYLVTRFGPDDAAQWVELAPDTFRARDGHGRLSFEQTQSGAMRMWLSSLPVTVFEQQTGLTAPSLHRLGFTLTATIFVLALIGWPAAAMRSSDRLLFGSSPRLPAWMVWLAWSTAALGLGGLVLLGLALGNVRAFLQGVPTLAVAMVWTHALFAVLAVLTALGSLAVMAEARGTVGQHLRLLLVALAALVHLVLLVWWNLLPWGLP